MTTPTSPARLRWIQLNGKEALFLDFSRSEPQESLALIDAFRQMMLGRGPNSVLLLVDVTDAGYEASIATRWKAVRMEFSSAIRASAVYGLSGLVGMAVRSVIDTALLLGITMSIRIFQEATEARAWLGDQ